MQKNKAKATGKERVGIVISDKMEKTIVVEVGSTAVHPVFKKRIKHFSSFKAHDEKNSAKKGDTVKINETRPISKHKHWRLVEVLEKAK